MTPAKSITAAIYARVSTEDQNNALQLTELRSYAARMGWEVVEYTEQQSSVKKRVVFDRLMADARLHKIDVVLVWKLDRFARSMVQLTEKIQLLDSYGVRFIAITQNIDTDQKNPMSRLIMNIMGSFAEFERSLIVERVKAGLVQYRSDYAAGRVGKSRQSRSGKNLAPHRPQRIFDRAQAQKLRKQGMSYRAIAAKLGVPKTTVVEAIKGVR